MRWWPGKRADTPATATARSLKLIRKSLHQRVPLYIGNREDVELAERFIGGDVS